MIVRSNDLICVEMDCAVGLEPFLKVFPSVYLIQRHKRIVCHDDFASPILIYIQIVSTRAIPSKLPECRLVLITVQRTELASLIASRHLGLQSGYGDKEGGTALASFTVRHLAFLPLYSPGYFPSND